MKTKQQLNNKRSGVALILSMMFLAVFATLAVGMLTVSSTSARVATNHHGTNIAIGAALSGLECAKYLIAHTPTFETTRNTVTDSEANTIWGNLCSTVQTQQIGGLTVGTATRFTDGIGSGDQIFTGVINFGSTGENLNVRFYRYDGDPRTILVDSTGSEGQISRCVRVDVDITKEAQVLNYAIASRGRMWVTQNSIIHGPIYSTWDRPDVGAGLETTSDTIVEGTINTIIPLDQLQAYNIQMETLDEDGQPMFDEYGNRIYSPDDKIQGQHEGINYGVDCTDMPGMNPEDYDTSIYKPLCSNIGSPSRTQTEYFPHAAGDYSTPSSSSSKQYTRKVYENQTFSNVIIPKGSHALFKNCTFQDVLFVETNETYYDSTSLTNNIRFEDCDFEGAIVSDVPSTTTHWSWWTRNVLYFTGEAVFDNQSQFQETTILAPNFNINLGNTGAFESDGGNTLSGAIVGGIVDVRGNAQIHGTIVSMYDTTPFSSGYVTNIGAADDGGSEGAGYVGGTIEITPDPEQLLPSGIRSPVILQPQYDTYSETI
ncbi:MAG: hypothetical protein JXA82_03365 [Sedimentisphaerales bacterium]|nr:hypothetical protein [Sedimentisphaerales bacterium]